MNMICCNNVRTNFTADYTWIACKLLDGGMQGIFTTPLLLFCRLASMLSAWVVTGLLLELVLWGADMDMMLPRLSGCALGNAGMPPPAAAHKSHYI